MTTKDPSRDKYRLKLRERDHGPPHVDLAGGDVDVLIDLATRKTYGTWPRGLRAKLRSSLCITCVNFASWRLQAVFREIFPLERMAADSTEVRAWRDVDGTVGWQSHYIAGPEA